MKSDRTGYTVEVEIAGHKVIMQLDTGTVVSIIFEEIYHNHLRKWPLTRTKLLRSYSGDKLDLLGELQVPVKYSHIALVVSKGNRVALFGRNWLERIKLNWSEICMVQDANQLINKYSKLFEEGADKILNMKVHIALQEQAKSVFRKARPVSYALKKPLEEKLDHSEKQGILRGKP